MGTVSRASASIVCFEVGLIGLALLHTQARSEVVLLGGVTPSQD